MNKTDELRQQLLQVGVEMEWTMGSWCVVSSGQGQTKVRGGRVVSQSKRRR